MGYRKIYIVSSGDFMFAGSFASRLLGQGFDVTFLCAPSARATLSKKIYLAMAFMFGTVELLIRSMLNRIKLRDVTLRVKKVDDIRDIFFKESNALFILINFDTIIKDETLFSKPSFLNLHPSILPAYRGLAPIFWAYQDFISGSRVKFGWTLHQIDAEIDAGKVVAQDMISTLPVDLSVWGVYKLVYLDNALLEAVKNYALEKPNDVKVFPNLINKYYSSPNFYDILNFHWNSKSFGSSYARFVLNGGLVGLLSWGIQVLSFSLGRLMQPQLDMRTILLGSILFSFSIVVVINFYLQRKHVFREKGIFLNFLAINLIAIFFVGVVTDGVVKVLLPILSGAVVFIAYPIAALALSPIVFLLKRFFVFRGH